MEHYLCLLFHEVLDIKAFCPIAPISLKSLHHIILLPQAFDDNHVGRDYLAILYTFDPEFLHQLQRLYILDDLTGDITAAVHLTPVNCFQEFIRIPYPLVHEGQRHIELAARSVSMPKVS